MLLQLRICFLITTCLLLAGCTVWGERPANHISEATGPAALERTFWNDVKAKNWTEIERHIAINYVGDTPDGKEDRASAVQRLQRMTLQDFSITDIQTELNGSTFIVNYSLTLQGQADGRPLSSSPIRMMTIWQHQKSGWIMIGRSTLNRTTSGLNFSRTDA
jgi:ketosteroid isomerase-like protein